MEAKEIAKYFKILSDETRVLIISMLKDGTLCACDMLEKLNITQPTLSYHMNMLSKNNIVTYEKKGIWVNYTINQEKLSEISSFLISDFHKCKDTVCNCKNIN